MHTYFLGLSLVGYDSLWGRMIRSGVAGVVGTIKRTSTFPNGDQLRTSFTGLASFDQFLIPAVIFYNNILCNRSSADRMLLISLFTTMQTVSHCMIVLGWNKGRRPWWAMWEHLFWGGFNQAWGAAAVYPLWCFTHVQRFLSHDANGDDELGPFEVEEAAALIPTAILGAAMPAMLLYPAFGTTCTTSQRQGLIAFYRFTPLVLLVAPSFFTWLLGKAKDLGNLRLQPARSKAYVTASLGLSGLAAAAGHSWALLGPKEGGLRRVFWPADHIDKASPTMIADGARDFLQWDIFVIAAALVPFADLVLRSSGAFRKLRKQGTWGSFLSDSYIVRMGVLTLASSITSPGAVLAFSLAARTYFH
ncbi:zn 2cys6 transcription factor [Colletotrichum musicola]|uniref:Zn 2cys6 transcription factor n=1 Tax=Colletotrichum musicola TaxID=2175873 RepID=A0A8H6JP33_9PEZI|nr:zn 2cys6 transcription factor [Colletotrichum musicola]